MGISYPLPRKRNIYKERIRELEEKNKKLEEELKLLKAKLEQPIIVLPIQKVENEDNSAKMVEEEATIKQDKFPITKLLKPGVFFEYADNDLYSTSKYTVQKVEGGIFEILEEDSIRIRPMKIMKTSCYYYVDKDRRCYCTPEYKPVAERLCYIARKCSIDELIPTSAYIPLWVNPFDLGNLTTIPILNGSGRLVSVNEENNEKLYCFRYSFPGENAYLHFFYDAKFGLLRKSIGVKGRIEYLVDTNLNYISTYPKPSSPSSLSTIYRKYGHSIKEAEEFKKEAYRLLNSLT